MISIDDIIYDPKVQKTLKHGDRVSLLNWKQKKYLNTHKVAAPISKKLTEVTGYINYNIGMEAEVIHLF